MVERDGNLRAGPIDDLSGANLENIVQHNVAQGTVVSTDEWRGYNHLASIMGASITFKRFGLMEFTIPTLWRAIGAC